MTEPPAPPPAPWGAQPPPPSPPGWPAQPPGPPGVSWPPPARTNGLAIASLIVACAQVVFWPLAFFAAIAAIITGHIARRQIRRTGEGGSGLALAGLIIGYIGAFLWVLLLTGSLVFIFGFLPGITQRSVRDDARHFGNAVMVEAQGEFVSPRTPAVIRTAYQQEHRNYDGCCSDDRITLADGTPLTYATTADYARSRWRLNVSKSYIWRRSACLTIPAAIEQPLVTDGPCTG